jgi:hypothetical protein
MTTGGAVWNRPVVKADKGSALRRLRIRVAD